VINNCHTIRKYVEDKAVAEKEFGFHLYQGGIVPGNELRIVKIEGIDTEACCGTHCDNTAEVGWVRILKSQRISDGIVRLYYVAQERAIEVLNSEHNILQKLCETWGIDQSQLLQTADRFFKDSKTLKNQGPKQDQHILKLQMKCVFNSPGTVHYVKSDQPNPNLYFSFLNQYAKDL